MTSFTKGSTNTEDNYVDFRTNVGATTSTFTSTEHLYGNTQDVTSFYDNLDNKRDNYTRYSNPGPVKKAQENENLYYMATSDSQERLVNQRESHYAGYSVPKTNENDYTEFSPKPTEENHYMSYSQNVDTSEESQYMALNKKTMEENPYEVTHTRFSNQYDGNPYGQQENFYGNVMGDEALYGNI